MYYVNCSSMLLNESGKTTQNEAKNDKMWWKFKITSINCIHLIKLNFQFVLHFIHHKANIIFLFGLKLTILFNPTEVRKKNNNEQT